MTIHKDIVDEGKECNNVVTKNQSELKKGKGMIFLIGDMTMRTMNMMNKLYHI